MPDKLKRGFFHFSKLKIDSWRRMYYYTGKSNITIKDNKMETQYYTVVEKQDFFEIIENKYGELAIFIDARDGAPVNPVLEFDGKQTALLKRDGRLAVRLDNIDAETKGPLAEAEFVMIVELQGKMVERVYAVPVDNVEEIVFKGRQTRADELILAKSREDVIKSFGAVNFWTGGSSEKK